MFGGKRRAISACTKDNFDFSRLVPPSGLPQAAADDEGVHREVHVEHAGGFPAEGLHTCGRRLPHQGEGERAHPHNESKTCCCCCCCTVRDAIGGQTGLVCSRRRRFAGEFIYSTGKREPGVANLPGTGGTHDTAGESRVTGSRARIFPELVALHQRFMNPGLGCGWSAPSCPGMSQLH